MRRHLPIFVIAVTAGSFLIGMIYLFRLRFESGDVYPPYSSLRADPLGTMVLYESLAELPRLKVRRDTSEANELPTELHTTYLHLAAEVGEWRWMSEDLLAEIESFVQRGGRLVITLRPVLGSQFWSSSPPVPPAVTNAGGTNVSVNNPSRPRRSVTRKQGWPALTPTSSTPLAQRWGVEFGRLELNAQNETYQSVEVLNQSDLPLPASLSWHSSIVLTNLATSWKIIYTRGKDPVMVQRQFGNGTVVLATDSYFLSNEAMWKEREPDLLAWLIGPAQHVIFDESHLGVVESSGVAVLMRKYRLTGVLIALVLLAGLFIWKNSLSLVPPYASPAASPYVPGKDAAAGFVNLLRRNIPPGEILEVCFDQWTRSLLHRANYRIAGVDEAQAIMERERSRPSSARNAAAAYVQIARALNQPPPPAPQKPD